MFKPHKITDHKKKNVENQSNFINTCIRYKILYIIIFRPLFRFKLFLGLRIFLAFSRNSSLMAWVALELNMLRFIPIMFFDQHKPLENRLKYFLVQSVGSSIFLFFSLVSQYVCLREYIIVLTLIVKLGRAPFHS